jgi:hypothetical protein
MVRIYSCWKEKEVKKLTMNERINCLVPRNVVHVFNTTDEGCAEIIHFYVLHETVKVISLNDFKYFKLNYA